MRAHVSAKVIVACHTLAGAGLEAQAYSSYSESKPKDSRLALAGQGAGRGAQQRRIPTHSTVAHELEILSCARGHETLRLQAKALDAGRMAAFAQRLAGAAQFLDAPSALGLLAVLDRMLRCAPGSGSPLA